MLQQYNFLYNQQSLNFRRQFISEWDVREILDFISVRGLFQKGGADTKVIVIIAEADAAPANRKILHATFRRSGRVDAEQGFDIDYYDPVAQVILPRTGRDVGANRQQDHRPQRDAEDDREQPGILRTSTKDDHHPEEGRHHQQRQGPQRRATGDTAPRIGVDIGGTRCR